VPGLDWFRRQVTGAGDLAGCRQESIQAGEPDHLIMGAGSQGAVEAGLLGAGVTGRHAVIGKNGNQPIGKEKTGSGSSGCASSLGSGYDTRSMRAGFPILCPISDQMSSRANTVRLLKQIVHSGDKELASAACLYLAKEYSGQYGCLAELISSMEPSSHTTRCRHW
jgi:hypothetical protein